MDTREKQLVAYDPVAFGEFTGSIKNTCEAYNTYDDGYMEGVERVEDWLELNYITNGVTVQKWIPVSERLPEDEKKVLCILEDGFFCILEWKSWDWLWNDGHNVYAEKDVTHWMPLPEPPKGE